MSLGTDDAGAVALAELGDILKLVEKLLEVLLLDGLGETLLRRS